METNNIEALIRTVRDYSPDLPPAKYLNLIRYAPERDDQNHWSGIRDVNEKFRGEVGEALYRDFTIQDISLIRFLLEQDTLSRSNYAGGDIVLSAFMLFQLGQVEDVFRIYNAKSSGGMDTWIAMDPYLLFGAGFETTQAYLKSIDNEDAQQILRFIEEDFLPHYHQDLDRYRKGMEYHYAVLKD